MSESRVLCTKQGRFEYSKHQLMDNTTSSAFSNWQHILAINKSHITTELSSKLFFKLAHIGYKIEPAGCHRCLVAATYSITLCLPPIARRLIVQISDLAGDKEAKRKKGDSSFQCFDA